MTQESKTQEAVANAIPEEVVITIVTTRGKSTKIKYSGPKVWESLKPVIQQAGYNLDNMKAVEGVNRHTLEHPQAVLPDGDFRVFLMPYESKGGAKRAELYATIRDFIEANEEKAKAHFNADKNYTTKSSEELEALVKSYKPRKATTSKAKAEAISDVVTNLKEAKEGDFALQLEGLTAEEKLDAAIGLILNLDTRVKNLEAKTGSGVSEEAVRAKLAKEAADEAAKKLKEEEDKKRQLEKEEEEANARELKELAKGFSGVKV